MVTLCELQSPHTGLTSLTRAGSAVLYMGDNEVVCARAGISISQYMGRTGLIDCQKVCLPP